MDFLLSAAKMVLALAVGLPLVAYLLQDRLLFYPQPLGEPERAEVRKRHPAVKEVFLEAGSQRLHAWHVDAGAGAPLVLYFGGNAEDVSWFIADAEQTASGVSWLLVNYRGYGASGGSPSAATITADALKWHDYAVKELKPRQVFAFGRSLGSAAAVHVAASRPLAGVILVTPFDSLSAVAKRHYWFLPIDLLLKQRLDSVELAPGITAPLLCIAAAEDRLVPPEHARRLYEAWAGPRQWVLISGAGHNGTDGDPAFRRSVRGFLALPGM